MQYKHEFILDIEKGHYPFLTMATSKDLPVCFTSVIFYLNKNEIDLLFDRDYNIPYFFLHIIY